MDTAGAGIPAQALTQFVGELLIPGGGQRHAAGIGGSRSPGANAHGSIGHLEARQIDGRNGLREHAVHAAQQRDLLLQSEFGQQSMGLGLNLRRFRRGRLCGGDQAATEEHGEKEGDPKGENRLRGEDFFVFHDIERLTHLSCGCIPFRCRDDVLVTILTLARSISAADSNSAFRELTFRNISNQCLPDSRYKTQDASRSA